MPQTERMTTGRRGRLTVYLGAAPGVGKTYAMLDEAHRRRARGTDVVIGLVETHGRAATVAKIGDLEMIPRRVVDHRGSTLTELDVPAVLERAPEVALVDELAHTNAPGSGHPKRWQDVHDLLDAGIDVVTTVNVQHLASLTDDVEAITGVRQRETVPDQVVRDADQIQLVDLSPEQLRRRLAHGNVYRAEQIDASLSSYFRVGNLTALRELALLWLADRVDDALTRYRADHAIGGTWPARERIVVAVTGGPETETLLRRAARIAQRAAGTELLAVHVLPTDGLPSTPSATIAAHRALTESLGGTFHTVVGEDVPTAVVDFARGVNATMMVVGVSRHPGWRQALLGSSSAEIARLSGAIDVHLVTHEQARGGVGMGSRYSSLSPKRRAAGWGSALVLPALLTGGLLLIGRDDVALATDAMVLLAGVVGVALIGGLWPAVAAAIVSNLCLNWFFTPPVGLWTIAEVENVFALAVFVVVAVAVASVVDLAARRSAQAYRARAEASTLAALSRSVLSGQDTAQAIVQRLAQTFAMADVRLEERDDGRSPWTVVAHERWATEAGSGSAAGSGAEPGAVPGGAGEDGHVTEVAIDDRHRLVLVGRVLPASDRQVVEAFGAQAGIVLERRRLREQAAQAEVLERTETTRTALLAAVSHDLRTPLAAIRTAVDGLASPDVELDREDRDTLTATIDDSTYRLERLIGNLLDLSRLQTGAVRPALRAASLEEVVPIAVEPWLSELALDVPEDLPLVHTDPGLFERVVANVVSNAVRHSPPGVKVLFTASAARDSVELRVADAGPGVPDDRKATMFEPFQRLDDTSTGGLGLGLAVASGLAAAVGARIAAEDTPGGGLTMVLTVPREPVPDERLDDGMVQ
jgi:two-component system sensor histidine kinase KdpD